jgi:hypothetical protein
MGDGPDQGEEWEFKPSHTEELLERSRLEALFEARSMAATAIRESEALYESLGTQISRQRAKNLADEKVRSSVVAYGLEAEPLLRTEVGQQYYHGSVLGSISVPQVPPLATAQQHLWEPVDRPSDVSVRNITVHNVSEDLIKQSDDGLPTSITVLGISGLLDLPSPITLTYELASEFFFSDGHDTAPRRRQLYMDQRISAQGFRLINQLLEDLSIMLPVQKKGSDEAEGKYEDLIITSD